MQVPVININYQGSLYADNLKHTLAIIEVKKREQTPLTQYQRYIAGSYLVCSAGPWYES